MAERSDSGATTPKNPTTAERTSERELSGYGRAVLDDLPGPFEYAVFVGRHECRRAGRVERCPRARPEIVCELARQ